MNRASADGHPLLAKAKESYHPARRLHKFLAIDPFFASSRAWLLRKTPGDLDEIVALWRETFGDDEPFIRSVAETNPGYLVRDEKGLAAMGFALKREKARYVYAFATRPDCRRLGYATAILDAIRFDFPTEPLALVPADEALVPFYECRGFTVSSRTAYVTMTCPEIPGYSVPDPMN